MPTTETYNPGAFEKLFAIEDKHFWFRARNAAIMAAVLRASRPARSGFSVLEVGCGTGNVLKELVKLQRVGQVVGTDLHLEGLVYARTRSDCHLAQADIFSLPFDSTFAVVGLFDVLEHLPNDTDALKALYRVVEPGGALVVTVPAHPSLWSYFDEFSHHCRRYRQRELKMKLIKAGFRVEYLSQYMVLVLPLMWAGRRLAALRARLGDKQARRKAASELAQDELRIPPLVNEPFAWLLTREASLVRRGISLPFGASLVTIARKPER